MLVQQERAKAARKEQTTEGFRAETASQSSHTERMDADEKNKIAAKFEREEKQRLEQAMKAKEDMEQRVREEQARKARELMEQKVKEEQAREAKEKIQAQIKPKFGAMTQKGPVTGKSLLRSVKQEIDAIGTSHDDHCQDDDHPYTVRFTLDGVRVDAGSKERRIDIERQGNR